MDRSETGASLCCPVKISVLYNLLCFSRSETEAGLCCPVKIGVLVNLLCVWIEVRLALVSIVLLKSVFLLIFCVFGSK